MAGAFVLRPVVASDVDAVLEHVRIGFESYVAFAPQGWRPPAGIADRGRTGELLAAAETWARIAVTDTGTAGHVAFNLARRPALADSPQRLEDRPPIPGLAHLWQLFVRTEWWGRGVAAALHAAAVREMRDQGFTAARLFTPTGQVRARRFYERRGWRAGEELVFADMGLALTEYRLALE